MSTYTKTTFNEGAAPGISAAELNKMGQGIEDAHAELQAHIDDLDPHPQYAKDTDLSAHLNDTTAAHAASAISFTPTGALQATDVQAALAELDNEKGPSVLFDGITPNTGGPRASLTLGRYGPAYATYNGAQLIIACGREEPNAYSARTEVYDFVSNTWTQKANCPQAREGVTGVIIGNTLYVYGGYTGSFLNTHHAFDIIGNSWSSKASGQTRAFHMAGTVGGVYYAMGGGAGSGNTTINEMYDPVSNTWTAKTSMPDGRGSSYAFVANGLVFIPGGFGPTPNRMDTLFAYDPGSNTWTSKAVMPTGWAEGAVAVFGGNAHCLGGSTVGSQNRVHYIYNIAANAWTIGTNVPVPAGQTNRYKAAAGANSTYLFLVAGGDVGFFRDVWSYDPAPRQLFANKGSRIVSIVDNPGGYMVRIDRGNGVMKDISAVDSPVACKNASASLVGHEWSIPAQLTIVG